MASLEAVFNHLVLPPKVPGRQDKDLESLSQDFVGRLLRSCTTLEDVVPHVFQEAFTSLKHSLRICGELNRGHLDRQSLVSAFETLEKHPLILHVVEQNAALFIRVETTSNGNESVIFEAFEASPPSGDVLASENALLWNFPGRASQIPINTFKQSDFQEGLADFLEKASVDSLSRFTSKTRKANVDITEIRDTTDPALITQMLMPLLDTIGSPVQVPLLQKRVRDEVNIDESLLPWRRHPFWLILRVAAQRELCLDVGDRKGRALYKMLIVVTLTHLLRECCGKLRPEMTLLLRTKICRRLAKMEMEKDRQDAGGIYQDFFDSIGAWLNSAIDSVTKEVSLAWRTFKNRTTRNIELLPLRASPADFRLSLPASGEYLDKLLRLRPVPQPTQGRSRSSVHINDEGIKQVMRFTKRYFDLSKTEMGIQEDSNKPTSATSSDDACVEFAQRLCEYLNHAEAYTGSPEHMSSFILNLFDLWVMMDKAAVRAEPLLREYHPVFAPKILDVLQLHKARDLARLEHIQQYIQRRADNSRRPDIFTHFDTECFAYQFYLASSSMQELQQDIQYGCEEEKEEKETEWDDKSGDCEKLTAKMAGLSCLCTFQGENGTRTKEDIASCKKCYFRRARNRIAINAFEEYLPEGMTSQAGIVFEINQPRSFEAYRNATWRLIRDIAYPTAVAEEHTPLVLRGFEQLQPWMQDRSVSAGITLASTAKSFRQTHFGDLRVARCSKEDVFLPFGPMFQLWDEAHSVWVADLDRTRLTLQHHCAVYIPSSLRDILPLDSHPPAVVDGPTSYSLAANQRRCPPQASLHEFSAYQRLLLGTSERWINILAELGSSNLNFSSGETTRFLSELAVQAGPTSEGHSLRDPTLVFQDLSFCDCLAKQIQKKLNSIKGSWREHNCMDLLITLSECLYNVSKSSNVPFLVVSVPGKHSSMRTISMNLIKSARKATLQWINRLREEVKNSKDGSSADRATNYAFRAAILCRRTFALLHSVMGPEDVSTWCQATIALQEFIPENLKDFRQVLIRDTKMAYEISSHVRVSLTKYSSALTQAIKEAWGGNQDQTDFSIWENMDDRSWVVASMANMTTFASVSQVVQFNFVEGYLLVDGSPIGKLSYKIGNSPEVKTLFGDTRLRTSTSNHVGMSYRLLEMYDKYHIHFGLRDDQVVIRAVSHEGALEFIPRGVFGQDVAFDLPASFVEDKVHWLNLHTQCLIIRPQKKALKHRAWDWYIDLRKRECIKKKATNASVSRLVDPNSPFARRISRLFDHFEQPQRMAIFQHPNRQPLVELTRFDLSFAVTSRGLLYESKLKMELDPNQDAGCLYGLESKIVLRNSNTGKRSILVPMAKLLCRPAGPHVQVTVDTQDPGNSVLRFEIDSVLGRLTCAPEPNLIFALAYLHAITSFPLPDPLTSKTGVRASMDILRSGAAQPWQPLDRATARLEWIAALAPRREFYPRDKSRLQKVQYDDKLTMHIQHDGLAVLARALIRKSERLQPFFNNTSVLAEAEPTSHLQRRGLARRSTFEPVHLWAESQLPADKVFKSRDSRRNTSHAYNVIEITGSVFSRPLKLNITHELAPLLQKKVVGGFHDDAARQTLDRLVEESPTEQWGSLVEFSRTVEPSRLFSLALRLGLLAFDRTDDEEMDLLRTLVAIARVDALKVIPPPRHPVFIDFGVVVSPDSDILAKYMRPAWPDFRPAKRGKAAAAARESHEFRCEEETRRIARYLSKQWPAARPSVEDFVRDGASLVDETEALEATLDIWQKCHANRELSEYVEKLQAVLDRYITTEAAASPVILSADTCTPPTRDFFEIVTRSSVIPSLSTELLPKRMVGTGVFDLELSPRKFVETQHASNGVPDTQPQEPGELDAILRRFAHTSGDDALRKRYVSDLQESLKALQAKSGVNLSSTALRLKEGSRASRQLDDYIRVVHEAMELQRDEIIHAMAAGDARFPWLLAGDLWPGTDTVTLLEQLRSSARVQFGTGMKKALVLYGLSVTLQQWLVRVRDAVLDNDTIKRDEYLANTGHENWDPSEFPDWLLMEIDGDLLIRSTQVSVAREIIAPSSKVNSVFQLMMGQGKTSCIVPMAIAILADSSQSLARLIVPKALVLPSAQILQSRIGGLVGRSVRHIPFSRRTPASMDLLLLYSDLHREVRREAGVLLTTPDHVLSFKLSGLQRLVDGDKPEQAKFMIGFSQELTSNCRDVIDESDLNLGIKTQLIYPSGPQTQIDGSPLRWEVAEQLLILVAEHANGIRSRFPRGLEIVRLTPKGFPVCYFLHKEAEDDLHRLLVDDICSGRTSFLRPVESAKSSLKTMRQHIRQLLTEPNPQKIRQSGGLKQAITLFADPESAKKVLLLLRGLLLNRVLLLCLKKRWNVQYGLHPLRDPVAVPYHSRGQPSDQAEFGHPDVTILLTALSYFYGSLALPQFVQSLRYVLKSDDPSAEYDRFVSGCIALPDHLRHYYIVNADDAGQVEELFGYLRLDRSVIIHFMNHFVFPLHSKAFLVKMSASSWDIPLFPRPDLSVDRHARTSGFSGTNDNRALLPLTIAQDDLPGLLQTNAEVLSYLLQARNRGFRVAINNKRQRLTEPELLEKLSNANIRILIDAGAYVLEMSNEALMKAWMDIDTAAKAGVYFDSGRAWVLHRSGKKLPLVATSWASNINQDLLVFFDESNCRGVDLKLFPTARAALTLAIGQTKDATVQAAMRLRELATTQSVIFFAPPEVDASVRDICKLSPTTIIQSCHVIQWLLEQTCRGNEQLQNLHIAQGVDFSRRQNAQWTYDRFLSDEGHRQRLLDSVQGQERQTLEQQYGPSTDAAMKGSAEEVSFPRLKSFMRDLAQQRKSIGEKLNGHRIHSSALEEVEQEREVEFQVEEVRQVAKPIRYKPLEFPGLHPTIRDFVSTGHLQGKQGFMHAFDSLRNTAIGKKYEVQGTDSRLYCSTEFSRTVVLNNKAKTADNFLRPVEWILWSPSSVTALIIIPEEAELLIPIIRRAWESAKVHLITYAAPVTKNMMHFNDLRYYAMPTLPASHEFPPRVLIELGLFAGRLYVSFDEYAAVSDYLQVPNRADADEEGDSDAVCCQFAQSPIAFLQEWLALRRQVQDIMQTPMGYILQGRTLGKDHPFFSTEGPDATAMAEVQIATSSSNDVSHDDDSDDGDDDDWSEHEEDGEEWDVLDDDDKMNGKMDGLALDDVPTIDAVSWAD